MELKNKWLRAILALWAVASIILSGASAWATPGNVDGIGNVDLRDVIMSLQVVAGLNPDGVSTAGDSDGDGAVGLAEAIYGLQFVSGIRHVISPEGQSFDASGGTGGIRVTAAADATWTAASVAEWISVTYGASGSGNGTVLYSVAENLATTARTGALTVAGRTFTVEQAGAPCVFAISPESQSFEPSGGTGGIDVTAGAGCAWTAESKAEWISVTSGASGSGNGTVSYTVAENTGPDSRTGTLTVAGKTFTVEQAGAPCVFATSPESQSFGPSGGTGGIAVTSAAGCAWTAESDAEWISVTFGTYGSGNGTVFYSVAENLATAARTGTLTVAGRTFTVEQAGAPCVFAISPESQSFEPSGGTGGIDVTAGAGCAWTAESKAEWISVTSGASGSGNGTVSYAVAENTGSDSRTGTLTVAGKTFTVEQSGAPCVFATSPESQSFDQAGGTGGIAVTSAAGCAWMAESDAEWISVTYGASGSGNGTVLYSVAENPAIASRTGTLTVADKSFTVEQQTSGFTNSLGMEFVRIPAGTFMMGSPTDEPGRLSDETQHQVTLTRDYYMMTTEVTQAQWEDVMGGNPSFFSDCGGDCPVETVSWEDIQDFILALNASEGQTYRLPTEAEWEYAARAETTTAFYNGGITNTGCTPLDPNLNQIGWYCGNDNVDGNSTTHPVAQKQPNDWGLYDMSGNVWEWCQDWYGSYLDGAVTDPTGSDTGSDRVLRGGSWYDNARDCRSAYRLSYTPSDPKNIFGFRLALSPGP